MTSVWFWMTPTVYKLRQVPEALRLAIQLSPVSSFVAAYQELLFYREWARPRFWLVARTYAFCAFIIGRQASSDIRGSVRGAGVVPAIEAQAVSKRFLLRHNASGELKVRFLGLLHPEKRAPIEQLWALKDVSLRIERGEAVALVGRNGSGKSTLLKLVAAIHRPAIGRLLIARGARIGSMIELGVGFHRELTGRENVFLNAAIHGLSHSEVEVIYGAVVDYSGLQHFIDVPIKDYSSGMHMRLGFAIAANLNPDILLIDEIFAVGDADFQERCKETLTRFVTEGRTIIFVSHSPLAIRAICRRVCVLEQGHLTFDGDVEAGLAYYERSLGSPAEPAESRAPVAAHTFAPGNES